MPIHLFACLEACMTGTAADRYTREDDTQKQLKDVQGESAHPILDPPKLPQTEEPAPLKKTRQLIDDAKATEIMSTVGLLWSVQESVATTAAWSVTPRSALDDELALDADQLMRSIRCGEEDTTDVQQDGLEVFSPRPLNSQRLMAAQAPKTTPDSSTQQTQQKHRPSFFEPWPVQSRALDTFMCALEEPRTPCPSPRDTSAPPSPDLTQPSARCPATPSPSPRHRVIARTNAEAHNGKAEEAQALDDEDVCPSLACSHPSSSVAAALKREAAVTAVPQRRRSLRIAIPKPRRRYREKPSTPQNLQPWNIVESTWDEEQAQGHHTLSTRRSHVCRGCGRQFQQMTNYDQHFCYSNREVHQWR